MKLQILLILIFNVFTVALVQSLSEVIGYIGENVTLTSRADPSWNLSSIDWLIFSNHWIATYRSGKTNINWVDRYNERLTLNISSGDLTIHDLNTEDATLYTVEFNTKSKNIVQKTELIVMKRLQEPTIHTVRYSRGKDGCWFQLHCSSTDKGVDLSWQGLSPQGNASDLYTFINATDIHVEFTCTSSRNTEKASRDFTPKCGDVVPDLKYRDRHVLFFLGGLLAVIGIYIFRALWGYVKGKLFPSEAARVTTINTSTACEGEQHV